MHRNPRKGAGFFFGVDRESATDIRAGSLGVDQATIR